MTKLYEQIGLETEVLDASPHRLIQMLLEKSLQQINLSRLYLQQNDIAKKCAAIDKAMDIVLYLKLSLNMEDPQAVELSQKLDVVYSFVEKQLLEANRNNSAQYLDAAISNLLTIKSGWDEIGAEYGQVK